jgi:hypothetical protein
LWRAKLEVPTSTVRSLETSVGGLEDEHEHVQFSDVLIGHVLTTRTNPEKGSRIAN